MFANAISKTCRLATGRNLGVKRFCSNANKACVTSLYDFHQKHGGKMVNFGGFMLPVQYSDMSITNSHLHTRKNASLFDVSHMLQTEILGLDSVPFLETLCTADLDGLRDSSSVLTVFTNDYGGILDDLIVTRIEYDHLYIVSNAGRKEHDKNLLLTALEAYKSKKQNSGVQIRFYEPHERALLALQGPKAAAILQKLTSVDVSKLYFMNSTTAEIADIHNCRITRCGYTGEDGFELSVPADKSEFVAQQLLNDERLKLAGLGARDSLRLEAGMCLYGSDITDHTTPVEAALTWLVQKKRRAAKDFPGHDIILKQITEGSMRKRVGFVVENGPPARHGAVILDENTVRQMGNVTSGCPSPSLGKNIAMGYVPTEYSKPGTKIMLKVREKHSEATIVKLPFVQSQYYTKP